MIFKSERLSTKLVQILAKEIHNNNIPFQSYQQLNHVVTPESQGANAKRGMGIETEALHHASPP